MTDTERLETEIKLRVPACEALEAPLRALGFLALQPFQPERSTLWDRRGELRAADSALRLRSFAGSSTLTWKGPSHADPRLKIRPEMESLVSDPQALEGILRHLGYAPVLVLEKTRALWRRNGVTACLDRTPVGDFVELEGEPAEILALLPPLGLDASQAETRSYPALYEAAGLGRP